MQAGTSTACRATRIDGQPCQAKAGASGYCWAHDPALSETRKQARHKGGKARQGRRLWSDDDLRPPVSIRSAADVLVIIERAIVDLYRLEISVARARAQASLAMAALKALETGELEQRLAALEGQIHGK